VSEDEDDPSFLCPTDPMVQDGLPLDKGLRADRRVTVGGEPVPVP
jgi:hypothetical protein